MGDLPLSPSERRIPWPVAPATSSDPSGRAVLTVSSLTHLIRTDLRRQFANVWVAGEITDLARPASGHVYFTLKDAEAQLRGVIWASTARRIPIPLQDGMEVLCGGEIDVYPRQGNYQLSVKALELRGTGAAQFALEQLRKRLAAEGLFDSQRKRPLPRFPRRVVVITSPTSAAVRDFLQVAQRRYRGTELLVIPVAVQGEQAVPDLLRALATAQRLSPAPDVIVVTRGGGSLEDLAAYNDEQLVRAVARLSIPVVSAIGHEIDVTLCDLVADVRALTPSEAAERVLPDQSAWLERIAQMDQALQFAISQRLRQARQRWRYASEHPQLARPLDRIRDAMRRVDDLWQLGTQAMARHPRRAQQRFAALTSQLEALSPLGVLARGFAVVTHADARAPIRSVDDLQLGDQVRTRLQHGEFWSSVQQVSREEG